MRHTIFSFIFVMWALILVGGGILVVFVAPISVGILAIDFGDLNFLFTSVIKGGIAIILVTIWIIILLQLRNWIFHKQIRR